MSQKNNGMILHIRNSRAFKGIATTLALSILFEMVQPTVSLALTEGPSQPEVQSFEPIGTTQMVDLFSGDFNYNIPLFNLPGPNGGYPVNLAYHAGVSMDDEASWVGLGWNINVGSLVRNKRGLPDEFKSITDGNGDVTGGDFIYTKSDMKESWTLGFSMKNVDEIFGGNLSFSENLQYSVRYNNYNGLSASIGFPTISLGSSPINLDLSLDSEDGLGITPQASITNKNIEAKRSFNFGIAFNGSLSVNFGLASTNEISGTYDEFNEPVTSQSRSSHNFGSNLSVARNNFIPNIGNRTTSYGFSAGFSKSQTVAIGVTDQHSFSVQFNIEDYKNSDKLGVKRPVVGYSQNGNTVNTSNDFFTRDFVRGNNGQITEETNVLPYSYYANDYYISSGQGMSNNFRIRRNDIGYIHDPYVRNTNWNASLSLEFEDQNVVLTEPVTVDMPYAMGVILWPVGTPVPSDQHLGIGGSFGFGWETQQPWDHTSGKGQNQMAMDFHGIEPLGYDETIYYQVHGENTIQEEDAFNHLNGLDLTYVTMTPEESSDFLVGQRKIESSENSHINNSRVSGQREVRNTVVQDLRNNEVENLGEFDVKHYEWGGSLDLDDLSSAPTYSVARDQHAMRVYVNSNGTGNIQNVSISDHPAGYKVLNQDGTYYVYGLPAYNRSEVQNLFSVDVQTNPYTTDQVEVATTTSGNQKEVDYKQNGTHKFLDKKTTSPYAHSYMLTSVQGADYVDITNNGPSDDDLGYWVKFDYVRYAEDYKWRAPYTDANFSDGQSHTREDDKASYSYGEKELWYLTRIETKTHIAIYEMSERNDYVEAEDEFINASQSPNLSDNKSGLKIDKIHIYEKANYLANGSSATPLQTVHFEYDYSLCQGVPNQKSSGQGKLTLKKVWFTSNGSNRGSLNKYEFEYEYPTNPTTSLQGLENPNYNRNAYSSWGQYHPYSSNYGDHVNFPYFNQTASAGWEQSWMSSTYSTISGIVQETEANKDLTQEANDLLASSWSLKRIKLPSGGEINIEYESDDYSHVQHKVANQMFRIVKMGDGMAHNELYDGSDTFYDNSSFNDEISRRIYFRLEDPLPVDAQLGQDDYAQMVYDQYVEPMIPDESGTRNLYFKSKMNLSDVYEFVRGYLPLENSLSKSSGGNTIYNYGVLGQDNGSITAKFTENSVEKYAIGFVTIQPGRKKNGSDYFDEYHPMSLSAWTYMQTSAPKLLNPATNFSSSNPNNAGDIFSQFANILNVVPATMASFGAIRQYCKGRGFARFIDLDNSGIRLASPDKRKFGGGHRVKNISITDNWSSDGTGGEDKTYGQHFDYTTKDENNDIISSGVATYEPQLGGDENALKYPVYSWGKNKMFTNNNLFTEGPFNEDLFPGASVGYRKVTVTSRNTNIQLKNKASGNSLERGRTTGVTVYEYYTSKDFPTIVERSNLSETANTKDVFKVPIPIPLIGSINRQYYHATQGFLIELNDMHGKPKAVRLYETNDYVAGDKPITESSYEYQSKKIPYQGEWVHQLINEVTIIPKNSTESVQVALNNALNKRDMGLEVELFTDAREFKTFNQSIGLDFNADIATFFPFLTFWPSINNSKTLMRTHVTNKVIHRSGILKKSVSRDLQTVNESEIIAYDEKSGTPMLTKTTNEFGDDFYAYNIPAYYHYENMGHAYQNIDYRFQAEVEEEISNTSGEHGGNFLHVQVSGSEFDHLVRGDELLVTAYRKGTNPYTATTGSTSVRGYLIGFEYTNQSKVTAIIHFPNDPLETTDFPSGLNLTSMTELDLQFRVIRSGYRNHYGSTAANYITRGVPDFDGTNSSVTVKTVTYPSSHNIETGNLAEGTVLSANANLFKDDWSNRDVLGEDDEDNVVLGATIIDNPYLTGSSGIWRPYKSFSYVDDRTAPTNFTANNTTTNPDLKNDGLLTSAIPMYSYAIGTNDQFSPQSNWEWTNEVTRFNDDSYEIENVNRIGIHSSALYGYDNSLTIAVGGNASLHELGAMDFESTDSYDQFGASMKQTNLNFHSEALSLTSYFTTETADILQAEYNGTVLEIVLDIPFSQFTLGDYEEAVGITLNSTENAYGNGNNSHLLNGTIVTSSGTSGILGSDGVVYTRIEVTPYIDDDPQQILPSLTMFTGKVRLLREKTTPSEDGSSIVSFVDTKAHTGKQSMMLTGNMKFSQMKLDLIEDKMYVLSMWISRDDEDQVTYDPENWVQVGVLNGTTFNDGAGLSNYKKEVSKIVEGWQKIDFEFSADNAHDVITIQFVPGANNLYVDDIRFAPKTGGITTHVYDPEKFWLRASLNVDNYATLYFYDEEGNLTIKKQETEEGVFTITEARGHVSEN